MKHELPTEEQGWADSPRNLRRIRAALYVLCGLLVAGDLLVNRQTYNSIELIWLFYALYGFAALVFAVVVAKGLRALVNRDEDYYDA